MYEDDPEAVVRMLKYIYGGLTGYVPPGEIWFDVFAVAGKYDVPVLLDFSVGMVRRWLHAAIGQGEDFFRLLNRIYDELPRHNGQLVSLAEAMCITNLVTLWEKDDIEKNLEGLPELSVKLLKHFATLPCGKRHVGWADKS